MLTGRYRLTKRDAARCLAELTGADLAVGTVSATEQRVSAALAPVLAIGRVAAELRAVLEAGAAQGHPAAQPLCRELLTAWPALWTFVVGEGVEPTNNAAEQALRPAGLWRKGSFGTHSDAGSRFVERMLTVTATCRQQDRSPFAFLVDALTAAQHGHPPPSLLPTSI